MQNNQNTVEFIETLTKALEAQAEVNSILLQMLGYLKSEENKPPIKKRKHRKNVNVDRSKNLTRKEQICLNNDTIRTYQVDTGLIEVKKFEYGIRDYVFYVFTTVKGEQSCHYRKINIWNDGREYFEHSLGKNDGHRRVFLDGGNAFGEPTHQPTLDEAIKEMMIKNKRMFGMA